MKNLIPSTQKEVQSSGFLLLFTVCTVLLLGTLQSIHAQMNFTSQKVTGINEYITDFFAEGSNVYITTSGEGIFISTDGGKTFTNSTKKSGINHPYVNAISVNGNTICVATDQGPYTSIDGGKTFKQGSGSVGFLSEQVIVNGNNIYVTGSREGLYVSVDGGNSFTSKHNLSFDYYHIAVEGKNIYAITGEDTDKLELYVSTDNGDTFKKSPIHKDKLVGTKNMAASNGTLYIGTSKGLVISTDGGQTCTVKKKADGLLQDQIDNLAVSDNKVYIGTGQGLSVSTDGGKTFLSDKTKTVGQLCVEGSTVHILSGNNYVVATGTPAPKPALPNPSDTYQLEFKHSSKVIQIDTGEAMETGIAEGFGASIGVEGVPEGEIGDPIDGSLVAAGDFVMDAALLQKTADKTNIGHSKTQVMATTKSLAQATLKPLNSKAKALIYFQVQAKAAATPPNFGNSKTQAMATTASSTKLPTNTLKYPKMTKPKMPFFTMVPNQATTNW